MIVVDLRTERVDITPARRIEVRADAGPPLVRVLSAGSLAVVGGGLDQAAADDRYVNIDGDVMVGPLQIDFSSDNGPSLEVRGGTHVYGDLALGGDLDWFGAARISSGPSGDLSVSPGFADGEYGIVRFQEDLGGTPVQVTGIKAPVDAGDAANKSYVDTRTPPVIVLGPTAPVPGGTAAGTVIVRRSA